MTESPSAVVYANQLYVFYKGGGPVPAYNVFDGSTWTLNTQVPNADMAYSPSVTVFNNSIYMFYQGSGPNGELWYNVYNGGSWSAGGTQVAGASIGGSPAAVPISNSSLSVLYSNSNEQLSYNTLTVSAGSWQGDTQVPGVTMQDSPYAAVCNGELFVLYDGGSSTLWYTVSDDGSTWCAPIEVAQIEISNAPSLAVLGTQLFCLVQGPKTDGQLWCATVNQGGNWGLMYCIQGASQSYWPGTAVFNNQLYCFVQGPGNNGNLYYNVFNGTTWGAAGRGTGWRTDVQRASCESWVAILYYFGQRKRLAY